MDRSTAETIHARYTNLAAEIERELGVKIISRLSYDATGFKLTARANSVVKTEEGAISKMALHWCKLYNLNPNKPNPQNYRIADYNQNARKNKFVIENTSNGKRYVASLEYVRGLFSDPEYWKAKPEVTSPPADTTPRPAYDKMAMF